MPKTRLAERYGISDVALAKVCRKLNVPVPERGYWAKLAAGRKIPVTPLPPAKAGQPVSAIIQPTDSYATRNTIAQAAVSASGAMPESERIVVQAELTDPHRIVRSLEKRFA